LGTGVTNKFRAASSTLTVMPWPSTGTSFTLDPRNVVTSRPSAQPCCMGSGNRSATGAYCLSIRMVESQDTERNKCIEKCPKDPKSLTFDKDPVLANRQTSPFGDTALTTDRISTPAAGGTLEAMLPCVRACWIISTVLGSASTVAVAVAIKVAGSPVLRLLCWMVGELIAT
jgi:hypothetical protein